MAVKTDLKINMNHVLFVIAAGVVGFGVYKSAKAASVIVKEKLNPASSGNVVYTTVQDVVGEEKLNTAGDYFFGAVDILNPFNESDLYAMQVFGLDKLFRWGEK